MLSPGTQLGTYEILATLGAGGMGEVYRARDPRLGREVAIKVLSRTLASDPDSRARFEREARTVAALNHPNIVVLHSVEEAGGVFFLTMELVEGKSLDHLVTPGGLPLQRVLDLVIPLADALAAAHGRGVVHRDLKPANVMVTREGRVKVLDFGLAKVAPPELELESSRTETVASPASAVGQVVGTVPYMSPEQIRGEAVDARSDLFSLGVLLYELLTGRRPFEGATSADVSSAILRDAPPQAQSVRGELPPSLCHVLDRCLVKDPERRIQTAKDVRNELELVSRGLERAAAGGGDESHGAAGEPARAAGAPRPVSGAAQPPSAAAPPSPGATGAAAGSTPSLRSGQASDSSGGRVTPSVAVLPFVNRSRDQDDEYFSDGLADELVNLLAKIRGLRVAARASSFQFKGKSEDLSDIGRKLKVATLLDGSVRKAGNRVRISVELVRVEDGLTLWSDTYDRTLEDIFAVQDDIAQSVVKELRSTLLGEEPDSKTSGQVRAEVAAAARGRGTNAEAHRLVLQGRFLTERLNRHSVERGIELLQEALRLDPNYALAWATLSRAFWLEGGSAWKPIAEASARASDAARRSLELEPDLAEGHLAQGTIRMAHDWDWPGADASFRRALELAPGNAAVLRAACHLARIRGRKEEAIALGRKAVEQDPLNPTGYTALGMTYRQAGRLRDAEAAYRSALEISPERVSARMILGLILLEQDRVEEGLAEITAEPEEWARLTGLAAACHTAGRKEESDRALRELSERYPVDAAYQIAAVHAWRGEVDEAFSWLQRAYAQRDAGLADVMNEPTFAPLHQDPRWGEFLGEMGLR